MAAARNKHFRHSQQQQQQAQQQQRQHIKSKQKKRIVVYDAWAGLHSKESEKQYKWHFNTFLKWLSLKYSATGDVVVTKEMLLQLDYEELEDLIIEYLRDYMHTQRQLKHSTINTAMATLSHFLSLNRTWLNTKKISSFIPRDKNYTEDRPYDREKEIKKLYDRADLRYKVVILLLANGLRIGAVPELELRDLSPKSFGPNGEILDSDEGTDKLYKINVYGRSEKDDQYYTFVTPECAKAIDDYLDFRRNSKEEIPATLLNNKSENPLIREQFDVNDREAANKPHKLSIGTIEKTLERMLKRANIKTTGEVMLTHGFRKYAITTMEESGVDYDVREYLVGHKISRGLDRRYVKSKENVRLKKWSVAINELTINNEYHLTKEVQLLKNEYESEIASLREEIERNKKATEHIQSMMEAIKPALDAKSKAAWMSTKGLLGSKSVL